MKTCFLAKLTVLVASGFGLGLSPFASGTCGAILGIPLGLAVSTIGNVWIQVAVCAVLVLLAVPICDGAEKFYGKKDDGRIVADEYMLLPICFIGQGPVWKMIIDGGDSRIDAIALVVFAFVVSRIIDILKPTPARQIQAVKGGLGVVLDDLIASIYSWIFVWCLRDYIFRLV